MGRAFARDDAGQTVVLVALMFTVLMGFAALSIDVGRFYSERRFMQDAVDSAALACAYKYAQGGIVADAWAAGDNVLQQRNLLGNPLGLGVGAGGVEYAALGSEVYDPTVAEMNLVSGILPVRSNGVGCRVAITVDVPTFLIKIVSPTLNTIRMTTQGYAKTKTGFLPSVVQRYTNGPGPALSDVGNQFHDRVMAQGQDWQCSTTTEAGCTRASTAAPGRDFVIFGQAAKASNDSSFRGYIGLDIRDFTNTVGGVLIHEQDGGFAYNGVLPTVNVQVLKDFEAAWVLEGYPGPDICVVELPNFKPCAQIAVINGSSSGQFVDDYTTRFAVGDKLMLQLYDGTVKTVPDFNISSGTLNLGISSGGSSSVTYTMSPQFAASGATVTTTLIPDNGTMTDDGGGTPNNPFRSGCTTPSSPEFTLNPTLPGQSTYIQQWNFITTNNCDKGIYQAWLRGQSSAPYTSRVHETLVNVNVGGQVRDFSLATSDSFADVSGPGVQADYVIRTTTGSGSTRWTGSNLLTLSWAKCPTWVNPADPLDVQQLICGIDGTFALLPGALPAVVPNMDPGEDHTFSVNTLLADSGKVYKGWVRETGLDDVTNKRVTHLMEMTLEVGVVPGGVTQYVDVLGYAVFEVTSLNSNDVNGRAITGAYADPNDPALAIGRKIGLVPWETP